MLIELIKHVCKKYEHCRSSDYCPFYDKDNGECTFEEIPEEWPSEREILERLEECNNEK